MDEQRYERIVHGVKDCSIIINCFRDFLSSMAIGIMHSKRHYLVKFEDYKPSPMT